MSSVCAIVPTFNRSAMLVECLESLLAQTRPVDEIVVVDDGSTDDTPQRLAAFSGRIRVIAQDNSGKAAALNRGLEGCRADLVWICDDDDYAAPDACERLLGALEADPEAGFAYGPFERFVDRDGRREFLPMSFWPDEGQPDFFLAALERLFVFQFGMLVRRRVYDAVGPFRRDLLRSQDYEMILRIARHHRGAPVRGVLFYQRQHEGQRGPRSDRFDAAAQAERWLRYDQQIFEGLRGGLTLGELTPAFARDRSPDQARRAALIQSACIYAKRALWPYAAADLTAAATAAPDAALAPEEIAIAERALTEDLACDALAAQPEIVQRLRAVADGQDAVGRPLMGAFTRPLVWKARNAVEGGKAGVALRRLRLMGALLGPVGAVRRLAAATSGGRARAA